MTALTFQAIVAGVAVLAGAVASVAGFGIGSLLTPTLGFAYGMRLAVAAVSIPHVLATALRFWMIRRHVDRGVLLSFGIMSAAGGLAGALLHTVVRSPLLGTVLGGLLVFAGATGLTGLSKRMHLTGAPAWAAGALSGLMGGLVGNQGGIRSAALLSFNLQKEAFVATATATALMVDGARMPVYFITEFHDIAGVWPTIAIASVGVLVGTVAGWRFLTRVPEPVFRSTVCVIILALGVALLLRLGS